MTIKFYRAYSRKFVPFLFLLVVLNFSCSKTITLNRLAPAEINIPPHIQRIVLIDRTEPENKNISIIQGILTGETPFEVRNAVEATMTEVQQVLNNSPRFEIIRSTERLRGGLFAQTMPEPLPWQLVEELCQRFDADAVLALERFSSDFVITDKKKVIMKSVGTGSEVKTIEVEGIYLEGLASVSTGFRMYDPKTLSLVDQQEYNSTNLWSAEAETRLQALALLVDKTRATQTVGIMAGSNYARRISPMPISLTRNMYFTPKSNAALRIGSRLGEVGKWEEAMEVWEAAITSASRKAAGRLCYNMALGKEIFGELDAAREWAGKAYTYYNLREGLNYSNTLLRRIRQEEYLRQQLAVD
jgi:hypothetical protein